MKAYLLLSMILAISSCVGADATKLKDFSPHLLAKTQIVWKVPTNDFPTSLWVYKRHGARIFPASVISNAVMLASLQSKGFPRPPLNDFFIWDDRGPNYPGPIPSVFFISPGHATIGYCLPHPNRGAGTNIPVDAAVIRRAWRELPRFAIAPKQVKLKNLTSAYSSEDETGREVTNRLCGRGVYLSRQLDGIPFYGTGDNGDSEGFWIELGSGEQVRAFILNWPDLDRYELQQTAGPEQILRCIRKQKIIVMPQTAEGNYFAWIKRLATAQRFTVTKITPYYGEGKFGEMPASKGSGDVPAEFVTPMAELEIVADFENSKTTLIAVSPILAAETVRLLKQEGQ